MAKSFLLEALFISILLTFQLTDYKYNAFNV